MYPYPSLLIAIFVATIVPQTIATETTQQPFTPALVVDYKSLPPSSAPFTTIITNTFNTPVILTNTPPSQQFQAVRDPEAFINTFTSHNITFTQVKQHKDGRPFMSRSLDVFEPMSATKLFPLLQLNDSYIRTSLFLSELAPNLLQLLLSDFLNPITLLDVTYQNTRRSQATFHRSHLFTTQRALWISSPHSITSLHMDELHNFYVQVSGRKRFMILPPEKWSSLYMWHRISLVATSDAMTDPMTIYPPARSLHSAAAAEAVRATNLTKIRHKYPRFFTDIKDSDWIQADLSPGDVLYLPPNWFHQVEPQSSSISLNAWTASWEIETLYDLWRLKVPLNLTAWDPSKIIMGLSYLVRSTTARVLIGPKSDKFDNKIATFAHDVLTRYQFLYDSPVNISHGKPVDRDKTQFFRDFEREALTLFCVSSLDGGELDEQYRTEDVAFSTREIQRLDDVVEEIGEYFDKFSSRRKTWYLAEFLEQPLSSLLGFPGVVWFFEDCLTKQITFDGIFGDNHVQDEL